MAAFSPPEKVTIPDVDATSEPCWPSLAGVRTAPMGSQALIYPHQTSTAEVRPTPKLTPSLARALLVLIVNADRSGEALSDTSERPCLTDVIGS